MESFDPKPPCFAPAHKIVLDDIVDDLFHEIQNGIHRIGMELELAIMGLSNTTDAAKATALTKSLENSVRDLRGYISSIQNPAATCDPTMVLQDVLGNQQMGDRSARMRIVCSAPQSLPLVSLHRKLLNRILERILDFCEDLLREGGELRITAGRREDPSAVWGEIVLTLLTSAPLDIDVEKRLIGNASSQGPSERGAKRAVEVFRRHRGEFMVRQSGDCHCEITLRISAAPG